ncbi:MAG TPA: SBBP repeat-containing protein [Thermomicrobiales bacterium]
MTGRRFLPLIAVGALAFALPAVAFAGPGDPDPTFSGDGQLTTGFGSTPFHSADTASASARDASGRIYIAGSTPANNGDVALVRLTAAGVVDTTFGINGIATADINGADDQGTGVAVDGSGNVYVGGTSGDQSSGDDFALVRFTGAGVLDTTFGGGDGIVTTDFAGQEDFANGLALVGGSPVLAGWSDADPDEDHDSYDFAVAKYTTAGVLDSTFDGDGRVTTDFGSNQDQGFAVLSTGAGSTFVVAGRTDPSGADVGDFALARYTASTGALDGTFGSGGKQTVDFSGATPNGDFAAALAVDSSNKIVVVGSTGGSDCGVARLSGTDGSPDSGFDGDGKQTVSTPASGSTSSSSDQCYAVAVQPDDAVVLGGTEFTNGEGKFVLSRVTSAGALDTAGFGTAGFVITNFNTQCCDGEGITGLFVDGTNSKIIATGTGNSNFAAARYALSDGAVDTTFGTASSGRVEVDVISPIPSSETATDVAVQPDGKIVAVGPTNAAEIVQAKGDLEFGVARYNADGSLDQTFGVGGPDGNGRVATNFDVNADETGTSDSPSSVAIQPDGKILVAGKTNPPGSDPGDFAIARYMPNGTLDATFAPGGPDGDGLLTTNFGGANGDSASGIATTGTPGTAGFRIVAAGTKSVSSSSQVIAVAAYQENGTPDAGFNGGQQTTDLVSVYPTATVAIQPDGKVLVAATQGDFQPFPVDFALVRYTSSGAPDPSFGGGDGIVTTDFAGGYDQAYSLAVQDLGADEVRIVVGGAASPDSVSPANGGLAVYMTDGSLDSTFAPGGPDGDGKLTFDMHSNNSFDAVRDLAIQPDGKIVGAGSVGSGDFGVLRVTSSGELDPGFGDGGLASTAFPVPQFTQLLAPGVALQSDGKIVAAGGQFNPFNGSDFMLARYGAPDQVSPPPPQPPPTTTTTAPKTSKKKCKKKKKKHAASVAKKKCKKKKKR